MRVEPQQTCNQPAAESVSEEVFSGQILARAAIAESLTPINLFTVGIGTVWFARRLPSGCYAVTSFLLDIYCLGVKSAMHAVLEADKYEALLDQRRGDSPAPLKPQDPAYVCKLVNEAVAYAGDLGFEPHEDYQTAKKIFGDLDPTKCDAKFTFGREGKPFYIAGPNDSPSKQQEVIQRLEARCGAGGFDYLLETLLD